MDEAEFARRRKDPAGATNAMRRALELESTAAEAVPHDLEPTRSILYRSAASIAAELGDTIAARRLAIAGLRGDTPAEIKAELFEVLDGLMPTRGHDDEGTVVQQLRIHRASPTDAALTIPVIAEIQTQWFRTIDEMTNWTIEPVLLDASAGSFVVRFELQGTEDDQLVLQGALAELHDVARFIADARLRQGPPKARKKHLQSIRSVLNLLSALTEANAILEVTTRARHEPAASFELRPPTRKDLQKWQGTTSCRIPSGDVPQADDLERVLRFVDIVAKGGYPTPETLEVVGRQVNYYRRTAEILGYLRDRLLSPSGRLLARLSGTDRWTHVLEHVTTSDIGSAWIDWSGQTNFLDIDPATAAAFLTDTVVGLSESTIRRRAVTLSTWHARLKAETGFSDASE